MRYLSRLGLKFTPWWLPATVLLLLLAVACGAAATATPVPKPTAAPAPVAVPKAASTVAPQPTPAAAAASVVSPGKVTAMIGNFGNERFDGVYGTTAQDYMRIIHSFLISTDVKDGQRVFTPGIATKWEMSSGGLAWTFTIRKGVKFFDGKELTAEDVVWTLLHHHGPDSMVYGLSASAATLARTIARVEQTGPDRVTVTFKEPFVEYTERISENTGATHGAIQPKRATLHDDKESAAYDRNPIGAGVMRLVKHVPLEVMAFERFADHYQRPENGFRTDKRVKFEALELRLIPEEATRVAALRAGEADIAPVSLQSGKQLEAGGGRLVFGPEAVFLMPNHRGCWKPQFPCHDKRVRQALDYAIAKEPMQNLYGGPEVMQVKGWSAVTPSTIGYGPELDPWPFDPVKARQLLADAGYPGGKGFGKLVINTHVSSLVPFLPESAQLAADMWRRELGLDVEVKVGDRVALQKLNDFTEDLYGQVYWWVNETRIEYAGLLRAYYSDPERGSRRHHDPELFALALESLAVSDPVAREKVLNSTYRRLRDEAYEINIGYINIPWGVGPRIRTWEPYPLSNYLSALHTIVLK